MALRVVAGTDGKEKKTDFVMLMYLVSLMAEGGQCEDIKTRTDMTKDIFVRMILQVWVIKIKT